MHDTKARKEVYTFTKIAQDANAAGNTRGQRRWNSPRLTRKPEEPGDGGGSKRKYSLTQNDPRQFKRYRIIPQALQS